MSLSTNPCLCLTSGLYPFVEGITNAVTQASERAPLVVQGQRLNQSALV